jgi:hypothetical protein
MTGGRGGCVRALPGGGRETRAKHECDRIILGANGGNTGNAKQEHNS